MPVQHTTTLHFVNSKFKLMLLWFSALQPCSSIKLPSKHHALVCASQKPSTEHRIIPVVCATVSSPSSYLASHYQWLKGQNDDTLRALGCCRPRLLATGGAWFLWDFSFYGNKVFQSAFIKVLSPSGAGVDSLLFCVISAHLVLHHQLRINSHWQHMQLLWLRQSRRQ